MRKIVRTMISCGMALALTVSTLSVSTLSVSKQAQAANHTRDEAVSWANAQIGKGLDYDGKYGNQCVDLIKYYYDYLGVANYATGNANAYITNPLPPGWTRVYGDYQPGDIGVWKVNHSCGTCITNQYGHVAIITSADSVGFNAVTQNTENKQYCITKWFNISGLNCAIRPDFSSGGGGQTPSASISFADFNQNGVWEYNAEMYTKIMNPNGATVSEVGCRIFDAGGGLLQEYREACNLSTSYINYNCNVNNDMHYTLRPGTYYQFELFAVVNGTEYKDGRKSFITTGEANAPEVSEIEVSEINSTGFTVRCKVQDDTGIDRVQFPTWTTQNGQDDIQSDWGGNAAAKGIDEGNGYYRYRVNIADHNNERGPYAVHIYAYDVYGNYKCTPVEEAITVPDKDEPIVTPPPVVTPTPVVTPSPIVTPTKMPTVSSTPTKPAATKPAKTTPPTVTKKPNRPAATKTPTKAPTVKKPTKVKKVKLFRLKQAGIFIVWADKKVSSFQVQYALNRSFTKKRKSCFVDGTQSYKVLDHLKKNKIYYVRVRAINKGNGIKKYGAWSAVKKIRTKK